MASILSFIVAFGVCVIAGQILIPLLRRWKAGQSIRTDGPTWHMSKQGTPTMGGLMFILAIGAAILAAGWQELVCDGQGGVKAASGGVSWLVLSVDTAANTAVVCM